MGIRCQLTLHLVCEFEIGIGGGVDGIDGRQVALHRILVAGEVADGRIAPVATQRPHAHYHVLLALGHRLRDDQGGIGEHARCLVLAESHSVAGVVLQVLALNLDVVARTVSIAITAIGA